MARRALRGPGMAFFGLGVCAVGACAMSAGGQPSPGAIAALARPPQATGSVLIVNSGSTNTLDYRIEVAPSGSASYTLGHRQGSGQLPDDLTSRFFRDLQAAVPLATIATGHCVKSTSFGSTTLVSYEGTQSGDLSCPASPLARRLYDELQAIERALDLRLLKSAPDER